MSIKNFYNEEIEITEDALFSIPKTGQILYLHIKYYSKSKFFGRQESSTYYIIGKDGFGIYEKKGDNNSLNDNLQIITEIRYDECEFIFVDIVDIITNGFYTESTFLFDIITKEGFDSRFELSGDFNKKREIKKLPIEYLFGKKIEKHLTEYLMKGLIYSLDKGGHYDFRMLDYTIRLSKNSISFVKKKKENIYKFDEIKSVYSKGTKLYIEDKDFQKKIFKTIGKRDKININLLVNKRLFLLAFSKYSGYNIY